jgi:hypothetical protein
MCIEPWEVPVSDRELAGIPERFFTPSWFYGILYL